MPALPFAAVLVAFLPRLVRFVAVPLMVAAVAVFLVATTTMPNAPERFTDPLFQLWLPSFASGQLAETAAWIRWGLDSSAGIAVFVVAAGLGLLAVAASFGPWSFSTETARASGVLAVLLLAFSFPFPSVAPVTLGWQAQGTSPAISIVEVGHVTITIDGADEVELRARIENRGSGVARSRLKFSAWGPGGEGIWTAWYDAIPIAARSRQTITMTWHPGDVAPGSLSYGFMVSDSGSGTQLASRVAPDRVVLGP